MKELEINVSDNWFMATVYLMDIPGKECESVGSRLGLFTRRIYGIKLD